MAKSKKETFFYLFYTNGDFFYLQSPFKINQKIMESSFEKLIITQVDFIPENTEDTIFKFSDFFEI